MPRTARILIYPGGRNARLAVMDLRDKDLLGGRTIVGFADDNSAAKGPDCRTLSEACVEWRPTHVLICARQPHVERTLELKALEALPHLVTTVARDAFVRGSALEFADETGSTSRTVRRALADIKSVTLVMCKTCNIRCNFCYQTDFTERMNPGIFTEKLRAVSPHVEVIKLVGGEVTAFRHALPFVEQVVDRYPDTRLRLTTNGILFDERWTAAFCATGGSVHNSIVAATPQTYHRVTGQDKHARAVENVRRTIETRNARGASLGVYIGLVITPDTQHEIEAVVELGASLGVDGVEIGVDTMGMDGLDRDLIERQAHRIVEDKRVPVVWDRLAMLFPELCPEPAITEPCTLPDNAIFVEVNGTVYACCHSHVAMGSLLEDDIETIWNARPAHAVSNDVSTGCCASCPQDCIYRPATVAR